MEVKEHHNRAFMATECQKLECISTQAAPIIAENGIKSLIINGLLDDESAQTYLNVDIAAKLSLKGEILKSQVNVISGTVATFETALTEFTLKIVNGRVNTVIEIFTISDITVDFKINTCKVTNRTWDHLRRVNFLQVSATKVKLICWLEWIILTFTSP